MLAHNLAYTAPSLDAQLDAALANAWMAYQPLFHAGTRTLAGHEALLRSHGPWLRGPLQVVEAARTLDRLHDLGRCARRLAAANQPGTTDLYVNLCAADLLDAELGGPTCHLRDIASRVVLEITEHQPVEMVPHLAVRLRRLRHLGFRIALDDFGAGHASLTAWYLLEPDVLKLDRALVQAVCFSRMTRATTAVVVQEAHAAGAVVVAEGIETEDELRAAEDLGCDVLQGYLLGRPAPPPQAV